ncbi:MAG: radical SAM protein [Candidatus Aminicenantes bacterium]|nr:radical SAM protein [Candidatus Aminicenantes bacterium]
MAWMKPSESLAKLPELLRHNRFSFTFDGVPLNSEDLSYRKKANLMKIGMEMMMRSARSHGLPPTIQIEPTNVCNLACPLCPSGTGTMKRPKGFMSMETFHKILDELQEVLLSVFLYGWGEPFLNQQLPQMIEACTARKILSLTDTNGQCLQSYDKALRVVDSGLTAIIIALDGNTQETYQMYRMRGDVEKVKRCIRFLGEAKAKRNSQTPYICVRTIVTHDNEQELTEIESLSRELGADMFSYKTVGMQPQKERFKDYEPDDYHMRRFEYKESIRISRDPIKCPFPIRQPTVFWDGTVVGCEYDYDLDQAWGNVGDQSLAEIWKGPQAKKLRRSIYQGSRGSFCHRVCPYQDRVQNSSYLVCKEL